MHHFLLLTCSRRDLGSTFAEIPTLVTFDERCVLTRSSECDVVCWAFINAFCSPHAPLYLQNPTESFSAPVIHRTAGERFASKSSIVTRPLRCSREIISLENPISITTLEAFAPGIWPPKILSNSLLHLFSYPFCLCNIQSSENVCNERGHQH